MHVAYSLEMVSESACCCSLSFSGPELAVLANALWEHLAKIDKNQVHVHTLYKNKDPLSYLHVSLQSHVVK